MDEIRGVPIADETSPEYLIHLINLNKNQGVDGEVKSSKSMLINTVYPNLLLSCDFLSPLFFSLDYSVFLRF